MHTIMDRKPAEEMTSAMGFHLASIPCRRFLRIVVMIVHGHGQCHFLGGNIIISRWK
jgi:hypothetical protein